MSQFAVLKNHFISIKFQNFTLLDCMKKCKERNCLGFYISQSEHECVLSSVPMAIDSFFIESSQSESTFFIHQATKSCYC